MVDGADRPAAPGSHRAGFVAIVGRPNVGKSTLLNRLLGQKLSITARRPQTTRHQILGIHSTPRWQIVYVDTPGIDTRQRKAINRYMNRAASGAIDSVHALVFLVEAPRWTPEDERIQRRLAAAGKPVILAPNKVDLVRDKTSLLPYLEQLAAASEQAEVVEIIPISARAGDNLDALEEAVARQLPEQPPLYPDDQVTDRSQRFLAAEIVREKLTRRLAQEIPYQLTVEIEEFAEEEETVHIGAVIWVERKGHKQIVIGRRGKVLKEVGRDARRDIERMLERHVFLRLWVKVREGWSDDERTLRYLGYDPNAPLP